MDDDVSDPLFMLLDNAIYVDPNALFIDPKLNPIPHSPPFFSLQPQDILNFSSPTLSSASDTTDSHPPPQTHVINTAVATRPKTSHTTIERRYRTNLNARIQSLKAAVPALRVLDQNYKSSEYAVDDRGYIDGVKVARKGSKANVLGKAVEYIRVLKKREARLKREQDGLRTLILGFPGGQTILAEWESEWVKKYGGPERDEIDNEPSEDPSDDDDADGDGEDDADERARKKPKIDSSSKKEKRKIAPAAPVPVPTGIEPGLVVEKRKRGRPRKIQPNIPPPITPAAPVSLSDSAKHTLVAHPQPQQYLLAIFALFSFFNSPLTASQPVSHHHTHQGSVLSPAFSAQPATGWTWNDLVQVVHLIASLAVFVSIITPWIPVPRKAYQSRLMQFIPFTSLGYQPHTTSPRDLPTPPESPAVSNSDSEPDSSSTEYTVRATKDVPDPLMNALSCKGATDELDHLLRALHVSIGWFSILGASVSALHLQYGSGTQRERRAWARLAELIVLSAGKISMPIRWQAYNYLTHQLGSAGTEPVSETLVSDLGTLALLAQLLPFAESRSQALWTRARDSARSLDTPAYQRFVLDSLSVEDAMECLKATKPIPGSSPIELLASSLLRKRLHSHASSLFIHRVSQSDAEFPDDLKAWRATLSYGRSLEGDIGLLSDILAKVWQDRWFNLDVPEMSMDAANEDVLVLLRATVLYGQVFASRSVPSPPPSPSSGKDHGADAALQLRRLLGSSVFEGNGEDDASSLEDARDRVVDMIVGLQRERRTRVS